MLLSAVLGVLVDDLLDVALGLWVCHMDVEGLCDLHVPITICVQSLAIRHPIKPTTIATIQTAM